MKICSECKISKDELEFHKNRTTKDCLQTYCKLCWNIKAKIYYPKYRKQKLEYGKKYRLSVKGKEIRRLNQRKWYANNIEKARESRRKSEAKRRITIGKLNYNVSLAIWKSLNRKSQNKNGYHWETLVGYTLNELKRHLENLFKDGMNWYNYGNKWGIDHIIPKSVFNYNKTGDIDFKRCWALSNLQPMWNIDNCKKSNKLNKAFQPSFAF